jgi:leucyl/phenylalanyl-tRNA--protein transferase
MSSIVWISPQDRPDAFPPAQQALRDPDGLLAAGGDLSTERLLHAYRRGIFPWFEAGQPILWWSPDPRAVLRPEQLHTSRSLRRRIARREFAITVDRAFDAVLAACAAPRRYGSGTWLTPEMQEAYARLHALGWAHSFEAWRSGRLVGGLYGIYLGRVFFGESMFTEVSDASKVAFAHAVAYLEQRGCALIDCQVWSSHLHRLGAELIPRAAFLDRLNDYCCELGQPACWVGDVSTARPNGRQPRGA